MEETKFQNEKSIYFTIDELTKRYRLINRATIYKWIKQRGFPKQVKIGGKALWLRAEIEAYDEKQFAKRFDEKNIN